ncbi:hypothetical protein V494_00880 [Pseudogymnoascus sp. VKM F-4513 (FW-928)]|nr:hypothetical protein V494_00880 [Pseudogymnoascus sp. VKM F-4513 (FW-928)]
MATQDPTIKLVPVLPGDFPAIARLESVVFGETDVGAVGFGPDRNSEDAMDLRAAILGSPPKLGETVRNMKLVRVGPSGEEEIVGYAGWVICVGRTGSEEEKKRLGTREAWAVQQDPGAQPFGPGADVRFCTDLFVRADEHMARATAGKDYAKLRMLCVLPECQRMGLGARMLEDGLQEADRRGLQSILGASPYGIGLYRRHGYVDFEAMEFKLWEYERGKGMGVAKHVVMHRPAVTTQHSLRAESPSGNPERIGDGQPADRCP